MLDAYAKQASVYDAIYLNMKDYGREAERVWQLINRHGNGHNTLLDVACGTGLHLASLRRSFRVVGLDYSPDMLRMAEARLEDIELVEADMRKFYLRRQFGAVTCLFSAIGHMPDVGSLNQAICCMAAHVEPGGVLIVEPWITPEMWSANRPPTIDTSVEGGVVRVTTSRLIRGNICLLDMHYHVGYPFEADYIHEVFEVTMFTHEEYLDAFKIAGLDVSFDSDGLSPNGRGVYIGVKNS